MSRRSHRLSVLLVVAVQATFLVHGANANVVIETVPVGNPGNAPDTRHNYPVGYGAVNYVYGIGKYEVTTGQYCAFLNAVAAVDTYELYSGLMDTASYSEGCNIKRCGSPGSYTYTVGNGSPTDVTNWANRPVNFVSWGDSARFANWMHNGQPTGTQGLATTEDGSYYLNGATSDVALQAVRRQANATWAITSEDEWYKAAYHANLGTAEYYYEYPAGSGNVPSNELTTPDPGNNANYFDLHGTGVGGFTIGAPYYRTPVGAFTRSASPYGTYDQGGNVWEWNEAVVDTIYRGVRGGSYYYGYVYSLGAGSRDLCFGPSYSSEFLGFRLAVVPEPATVAMLVLAGAELLRRRRAVNGG